MSAIGSLKERVLYYQQTGIGLQDIICHLAPKIYHFPKSKHGSKEDDCGEFFVYFYPRLIRTVRKFRDQGKPFEWYFNSVLCWQYRSYSRKHWREEMSWGLIARAAIWAGNAVLALDPEIEVSCRTVSVIKKLFDTDRTGRIRKEVHRKCFLFWILKYARRIDSEVIGRIHQLTGYEENWLDDVVEELRLRKEPQEERLMSLTERVNRTFCRARLLEERLSSERDREMIRRYSEALIRAKHSIDLTRSKISRIPLSPSNRQIGEVLDVPKGTVDSSLYSLKKKLKELYADAHAEESCPGHEQ